MPEPISAWWLLPLAPLLLLLGDRVVRAIPLLDRFHVPVPVVGGLLASGVIAALLATGIIEAGFSTHVDFRPWTGLVSIEPRWLAEPPVRQPIHLPFLVGFFTCIGLSASATVVKRGSLALVAFWGVATLLAVLQNLLGVSVATAFDEHPLLGLVAGSVSMTGGHGTALGFAPDFVEAGLASAATLGAAAATFGLVAGGLVGGPVAAWLMRRHELGHGSSLPRMVFDPGQPPHEAAFPARLRALLRGGFPVLRHVVLLLLLLKLGAWVSYGIECLGLIFPPQMGAMLLGVLVRNVADHVRPGFIDQVVVDRLGEVLLAMFLAIALGSLNLLELRAAALPLVAILAGQVVLVVIFTSFVTFRCCGRDYEAAVMAAGHCGFGLGATPNAIANMAAITARLGPAPRAFIVVPTTGALLMDFSNPLVITLFANLVT